MTSSLLAVLSLIVACTTKPYDPENIAPQLLSVAESSDWQATGRDAEVKRFVEELARASELVNVVEFGVSAEGRSMPMMIIADPPCSSPMEVRSSDRLVVYAQGGIHSGECCGKEALQILARELALTPDHPFLDDLIILIVPNYNPDGNERMKKDNRPGQVGPVAGMGQRPTAEGYDLNRDNTKLDSPEAQALARMLTVWDPLIVIDTHTTNGSYHQNTLTFDGPVNPAGDQAIVEFVREQYLPTIRDSLREKSGYKTTFYGNYNREMTAWATYDGRPRFGTRARGIRGIISILTEAYSYATYKDRVQCTKLFCEEILDFAQKNRESIEELIDGVRTRTIQKGTILHPSNKVSIRCKLARNSEDLTLEGWVMESPAPQSGRQGRPKPTQVPQHYRMQHWGSYETTLEVLRPLAYAYPASMTELTKKLEQHGIEWEQASLASVPAETYRIESLKRAEKPYQNHRQVSVKVKMRSGQQALDSQMILVRTAQPLGNLLVYLLEPMAADGLLRWNLFDDVISEGKDFPVIRVMDLFE